MVLIGAAGMFAGAVLWETVVKPIGRYVAARIDPEVALIKAQFAIEQAKALDTLRQRRSEREAIEKKTADKKAAEEKKMSEKKAIKLAPAASKA